MIKTPIRAIVTEGAIFATIRSDLLWMLAWTVVLTVFSNITFGFKE